MPEIIDLTGQKFGKLTALHRDSEREKQEKEKGRHTKFWMCKCECGTIKPISQNYLRNGKTISCGCSREKTPANFVDLKDQKFGRLTVIERFYKKEHAVHWKCTCDCGKEDIIVSSGHLTSGHTQSCGCLQKEKATETHYLDLTGKRFERLLVLERDFDYASRNNLSEFAELQTFWKCKCDCGTIVTVASGKLVSGHTKSCGCLLSYGEILIAKILKENNISFKKNYKFDDFKGEKDKKYRFDFGILDKDKHLLYLIEFDGEQHFDSKVRGWNTEENIKGVHKRDRIKNNYCFTNNIPLIRIPYTRLKKLTLKDIQLETTKYILTQENESKYYEKYNKN